MTRRTTLALALAAALLPAGAIAASGLPPLVENRRVVDEFFAAAVGDEIRKNCPSIRARMFTVLGRLNELNRYARSLGYSSEDIEAFRKSEENKRLLNLLRDEYLAANGVVAGDAESYCRLGRSEIEKQSRIGTLLKAS